MENQVSQVLGQVRDEASSWLSDEVFLSKFAGKDRKGIARRLVVYEEKMGLTALARWCQFAQMLMALAPYPAKLVAQEGIQFYIPDGKYHMQVFALQVLDGGALAVYAGNILDQALRAGILSGPYHADDVAFYRIGQSDQSLAIITLDGQTLNPAPACKGMTGWHRKAICITLPSTATDIQVEAVESLCALSAVGWVPAA